MTALIIDDDKDFCLLLKKQLEKRGASVRVAHSLKDGLQAMDKEKINVLFLDNHLSDGSGWNYAKNIKAHYPDTLVNLISGVHSSFTGSGLRNEVIWEKPLTIDQIDNYIGNVKRITGEWE